MKNRFAATPRLVWPVVVVVATAVIGTIPKLASRWFYQRGDTAVQFAPTWYHLGKLTRDGVFPAWLDPSTWAGGNYAAEALFGIYDPLNIPIWLAMSSASDLMTMMFLIKLVFLVVLALGTYFLCVEYGAQRWAAAALAVALPFGGFTLFWDAGSWASGLIAFAYTPWVWFVLRKVLRGTANPFWGFVLGVLAITQGNPYGVLALVVVGLALVVEGLLDHDVPGVLKLAGAGACSALVLPLVYLPLLGTSSLTVRSLGALVGNTGKLQPVSGDLLQLSMPSSVPPIIAIVGPMAVPATYLAWFVLPLLPWLRWAALRVRTRSLAGPLVVGVIYLALTLAPSKLWMFRWPLRVSEYLYLAVVVLFAVLLSEGFATTHARRRLVASAVLIGAPAYLAWAQSPVTLHRLVIGTALVIVLTGLALLTTRLGAFRTVALAGVFIAGTGLAVAMQLAMFGENKSSRGWHVPSDVAALQSRLRRPHRHRHAVLELQQAAAARRPGGPARAEVEELPARKHVRRGRRERGQPLHRHGAGPLRAQSLHVLRRLHPAVRLPRHLAVARARPPAPGRPDEGGHRRRGAADGARRDRAARLDPPAVRAPGGGLPARQARAVSRQPPQLPADRDDRDSGSVRRCPP